MGEAENILKLRRERVSVLKTAEGYFRRGVEQLAETRNQEPSLPSTLSRRAS